MAINSFPIETTTVDISSIADNVALAEQYKDEAETARDEVLEVSETTYDDLSDLQANAISGGDGTIHTTRKEGFSYTETSEASSFDFDTNTAGYHREMNGLNFYVNSNAARVDLEAWGVEFDDVTDNQTILCRAFDYAGYLATQHGGCDLINAPGGLIRTQFPPMLWSKVHLDLNGGRLYNDVTSVARWGTGAALAIGHFQRVQPPQLPWKSLQAASYGDMAVQLTTAADASSYSVGEMIFIADVTDMSVASLPDGALPERGAVNRVLRIDSGWIYLEYPLDFDGATGAGDLAMNADGTPVNAGTYGATGLYVATVDQANRVQAVASPYDPGGYHLSDEIFVSDGCSLVNGTIKSDHVNGAIYGQTFVHEGLWENLTLESSLDDTSVHSFGGLHHNSLCRSLLRGIKTPFSNRPIEIKNLSHDLIVEDYYAYRVDLDKDDGLTEYAPVSIGERSRNVTIKGGLIDLGSQADSTLNPVYFSGCENCGLDGVEFRSGSSYGSLIYVRGDNDGAFVRNCNFHVPSSEFGVNDLGVNSDISGNTFHSNLSSGSIKVSQSASGSLYSQNTFMSEAKVRIETPETGGENLVKILDNIGIGYIEFASDAARLRATVQGCRDTSTALLGTVPIFEIEKSVSYTTEALIGSPRIVAAGAFSVGDIITLTVDGETSGSTGAKYIRWRCAVDTDEDDTSLDPDDDQNISSTVTLPAPSGDWYLEARVVCKATGSSGQLIQTVRCVDYSTGDILGSVARHVSADLTKEVRLELSGWVEVDGEGVTARSIRYDVLPRTGFKL